MVKNITLNFRFLGLIYYFEQPIIYCVVRSIIKQDVR